MTPLEGDIVVSVDVPQTGILRQMLVAPGQDVAAGTPMFEVVRYHPVWVRTPIYSGDIDSLQTKDNASVRAINASSGSASWTAIPVQAPPTADPLSTTSDLYYELPNRDLALRPGQKVAVSIPVQGSQDCLVVPYGAILLDMQGGTWVYEELEPWVYSRQRVLVDFVAGPDACLAQGPKPGTNIVTAGATELFGEEFGVGH